MAVKAVSVETDMCGRGGDRFVSLLLLGSTNILLEPVASAFVERVGRCC